MNLTYKMPIKKRFTKKTKTPFELFAQNASIPGCNYLMNRSSSTFEKLIWILINIASLASIVYVVLLILQDWEKDPTFVTADVAKHPVMGLDFPAISICDINKISKWRAVEYARHLSNISNTDFKTILSKIQLLGNLYDYTVNNNEVALNEFEEFLDIYDNVSETNDLAQRLVKLTPSCKDILMNCLWKGKRQDCSELFETRLSDNGFCCMFNYMRPVTRSYLYKNLNVRNRAPRKLEVFDKPGKKFGLTVTLRNNYSDYFYVSLSTVGHLIQIFDPHDYPDKHSGALKDVLLGAGREGLIDIEVSVLETSQGVRRLPSELRTCKFPDEGNTLFGDYSNSDCLVQCKINSMESLCGCVPFMLPLSHSGERFHDLSYCSLPDLPCLYHYKEKFTRYYPSEYENVFVEALQAEKHESLKCNCQQECDAISFKAHTNFFPFKSSTKNASKLNIFFTKSHALFLKSNLVVTWFEGLSTFGGTVALFAGVSIINLLEVMVFLVKIVIAKTSHVKFSK